MTVKAGISGFRPRLAPTVFTIAVVLSCAALGVWQLHRLDWKRALIAQRQAALTGSPVALPRTLADARALEFHPVVAEGVFQHDREIFLGAIGPQGAAGFDVLTPLRETDGSTVFINRGFVPTELKDPARRAAGQPGGPVRVAGLLRVPPDAKPGWFVPGNRPDLNYWFWIDLPAISAAAGLADAGGHSAAAPFYLDADATPNPGGWPRGGGTPLALPNDHLQYALTWFALAAAALVIFLLSQRSTAGMLPGDAGKGDAKGDDRISRT
jgi:surfeit locus 1 family protein